MNRFTWLLLAFLCLILAFGCWSNTNIGKLFSAGVKGDGQDEGFPPPPEGSPEGAFGLNSLESGMIFNPDPPTLDVLYPGEFEKTVALNTFVAARFSESMNPTPLILAQGMELVNFATGDTVEGTYSMAPGSGNRIAVFEPTLELEESRNYNIYLKRSLLDAQNTPFDPGGALEEYESEFTTRQASTEDTFYIFDQLTFPEPDSTTVFDGTSVLIFFSQAVDTSDTSTGLGGTSNNFQLRTQSNDLVEGTRSFHYDDRMLRFTPDEPLEGGNRHRILVREFTRDAAKKNALGEAYEVFFTTVDFPRVTDLAFTNTTPLVSLTGGVFQGKANLANQAALDVTVTLKGTGNADQITLLFWRTDRAIIEVYKNTTALKEGSQIYTVNLIPEGELAITDGRVTVGAYTTKGGVNSPVGPGHTLPDVLKDTVPPVLTSLGPPSSVPSGLGVTPTAQLTEIIDPAFHGRANEDLSEVSITYTVGGTQKAPATGIKFFSIQNPGVAVTYSEEVTRGLTNLFITGPIDLSGGSFVTGNPPVTVDEIVLTDLAENSTTMVAPIDGSVDFRGYFFSFSVGSGTDELTVYCYDKLTLNPLVGVDVIMDNVNLSPPLGAYTDAAGKVVFTLLSGYNDQDRVILTLVKDGYQVLSYTWAYEADGAFFVKTASLLLEPESTVNTEADLVVEISSAEGVDLDQVHVAGTELVTGSDDELLDAGTNPSEAVATLRQNRLQFLGGLGVRTGPPDEYHWGWSNPFVVNALNPLTLTQVVVFPDALAVPGPHPDDLAITELVQPVSFASVLGAAAMRQARLMVDIPGIDNPMTLGADFTEELVGSDYKFRIPLPRSLYINETIDITSLQAAALDPPYELVMEPALGPATNAALKPDESGLIFPGTLSYEIREVGDVTNPPIVATRLAYALANLNVEQAVTLQPSLGDPTQAGSDLQWSNLLRTVGSGAHRGIYKLFHQNPGATRTWITLMGTQTAGGAALATYTYPDLASYASVTGLSGLNNFNDFTDSGVYPFSVEAFFLDGFNLTHEFLSTLRRNWALYWRSGRLDVNR